MKYLERIHRIARGGVTRAGTIVKVSRSFRQTFAHRRTKPFILFSLENCSAIELPYIKSWATKYKDAGLVVVAVHAPEFGFEKERANVENAVRELNITFAVPIDSNHRIWQAFGNEYWPWNVGAESAVLQEAPGKIPFRFHSRDLHMVLAPPKNGKPVRFRVKLDGATRAKITELISMPMGPARSGSRECINSFGKKVRQETDSLRSSSLIPALKPFRSRLAEVASKEY